MTKNRKIAKIALIGFGCCCIIAATALTMFNKWSAQQAGEEAEKLVTSFSQLLEAAEPTDELETGVDEILEAHAWISPEEMQNEPPTEEPSEELATVYVGNYEVCGSLSIPSISTYLAIISQWSYPNLNVSACRFSGSPDEQMVILGHNYAQHFGRLKNLVEGDAVKYTDANGVVYNYKVTGLETWATSQLKEIVTGDDWDLTLFTCTYDGGSRVVVRCSLVDGSE